MRRLYLSLLIYFSIQFVGAQIPYQIRDSIQNQDKYQTYDSIRRAQTDLQNKLEILNENLDVIGNEGLSIQETAEEVIEKQLGACRT